MNYWPGDLVGILRDALTIRSDDFPEPNAEVPWMWNVRDMVHLEINEQLWENGYLD